MYPRELQEYFDNITGHGVLATADAQGKVNQAVFARPHVMEDGTAAFIMPHRLTHKNLQENPHAAYLFMESGPGYNVAKRCPAEMGASIHISGTVSSIMETVPSASRSSHVSGDRVLA